MTKQKTKAHEDLWLDDNHCSEAHQSKTTDVLRKLHADNEIIQVYQWFCGIRNDQIELDSLRDSATDKQLTTLEDLIKIHHADWLLKPKSNNAEGLRRLLFAMINDVRLVLILLAEQLVLMRAAVDFDETLQQQLATSTMTYHAALANRLGVWQIKWELEDLSFRFLHADQYKSIAKKLAEKRNDREQFISACSSLLTKELAKNNVTADIAGRPKHIYSIYKKMQQKNLEFEGLFDIRAIRVLVDTVADCYATLGIVHATWSHIPKEFDDYIAQPKGNNYQSLHTVVVVDGKTLEVQIRTHEMHEHAELGVAAHWRYKDGSKQDQSYDNKVNWMRQLLSENSSADDLLDAFQSDTQEERIYVFTPSGDVVDLPFGSTPVDFAYQVHTEVGHRCRGAKVNGSIVPLTRSLNTGDQIEILTAKYAKPSRDWLHEQSGYLQSARARAKVRHWFRENDFDKNLQLGKELLENELNKYALENTDLQKLLDSFNLQHTDKLYAMIATGDITVNQVLRRADAQLNPVKRFKHKPVTKKVKTKTSSSTLIVEGVNDLKTTLASCCEPVQGDAIGGYITLTRGITVHRANCENYLHMISEQPSRLVNVKWNDDESEKTVTALLIIANNRKQLIRDISALLAQLKSDIMALNAEPDDEAGLVNINITIQVDDFDHLSEIMSRLSSLEHINSIQRNINH
ncbi:bifunctional (p)ppGpp synthetase/guanosine-3',5'-bis(diphosphate) 3'-pyrophosphohydrolase [Marinicella sp. S1101]|uniref:RelA/SpoT family protein n=1 Tax=Marinicella marina TaxID=2996016 RepID=UPI002260F720|nr:bifunctional (p)ppGpp synthetase/guanosine-3',5'-bis(diphosphate) 3'-pyrophosphohydrolase [Marinicella marina]MCX7553011.1 bifunctional (p)ppGpp synthetase/guanosine-3',5'-bis(diphosphate) 3'-pyrophosphohydrolase [Marinicella marina]MDJ1139679.1 bifunctional (p)ppGpp synthetase/guanosine-3',5'-bis(diphosphate) 3'-pyrophosphohydrolase [Marinicella marina]